MPYVRTVKTASGATAVQIVHSSHRVIVGRGISGTSARLTMTLGVELLKAAANTAARQRLAAGQGVLELGMEPAGVGQSGGPLLITTSRMDCLQPLNCEGASGEGTGYATKSPRLRPREPGRDWSIGIRSSGEGKPLKRANEACAQTTSAEQGPGLPTRYGQRSCAAWRTRTS